MLCDLLKDISVDQCMCFTNFDHVYVRLKGFMMDSNIPFRELDGGNVRNMDDIIKDFKQKKFNVLLADSSMYSCGMNLENIKNLVFIHRMDGLRETQIIGRAQRYGREGILQIWRVNYC